ncbi:RNA-binding protein [Clostridium sp. D2Q-14]|uniref:YlmH family RNA-binding protein n=1 Tax=Anaeromonas gelatinilytica TaxID=2683194 RepID=UPI00193C02AA|nr:YlmH/Sll1252 family protein [Anaeromonas gelatinilytica]MBS4534203.1 RNA-binding protein [Anaeromonas gelatinilytica]
MLKDKKKYLEHINDKGQIIILRKILDDIEKVIINHSVVSSDFLDPHQRKLSYSILNRFSDIDYYEEGGYDYAERKIIIMYPEYLRHTDLDNEVSAIEVRTKYRYSNLNHKDFLGALLGLGVKREIIGDIIVSDDFAHIIMSKELKDYILLNLDTVGKESVNVKEISLQDIYIKKDEYEKVYTTVSSLRLDTIVSSAFNLSRNDSSKIIKGEKVKVNFQPIDNISYCVNEGDLISVRKKGRMRLESILGESKKGKLKVQINKYI